MEKILFVATIDQHIRHFHLPFLKWFKEQGYEVHVASNGNEELPCVDQKFDIPFERWPFKLKNVKSYFQLKNIINNNNYRLIHCHTPMGGVITRLAARGNRKNGVRIIYTAHGFHFYKGASLKNWLIYYPIEKWLSKYADCLITINKEDYEIAKKKFKSNRIELINGVGVDLAKFKPQTPDLKYKLRNEYGYNEKQFILIYVGELSYRKHQDLLIEAVGLLKNKIPNIKLLLVGKGSMNENYKKQINNISVNENVELLGYRTDVNKLMMLADIGVSSSRQEGLPVNIMEAMAIGLPLIVSDCRGNKDLVNNEENGYILGIDDVDGFAKRVLELYKDREQCERMSIRNIEEIKELSVERIVKRMEKIYYRELGN